MKFKELQKKEEHELQKVLKELRERYQEMKFKVANNQLKNIREIREVKKNIAHILFLLKDRKIKAAQGYVNVEAKKVPEEAKVAKESK